MRNLIFIFTIALLSNTMSWANNNPVTEAASFTIDAIAFAINLDVFEANNMTATFDAEDDSFVLSTDSDIQFLQVLNSDGSLEYQLPIFSKNVTLDMKDFVEGEYQLNLLMTDEELISSTFKR